MTPEQARALVATERPDLAAAAAHLRDNDPLRTRTWLDARHPRELSLAILDCVATQAHFASKFENAERWLLSREPAEQATPSRIALWRACYLKSRFPTAEEIVELGTGLGGDSVYLARQFSLHGFEGDAARAELARANLAQLSPQARVAKLETRLVEPGCLSGQLLFADPARRAGSSRSFDPERWSPPLSSLLSHTGFSGMVLKTAPGLDLSSLPPDLEVHFLCLGGDLKEAMLVRGATSVDGAPRHAWLWPPSEDTPMHRCGHPTPSPVPVREPRIGDFLLDPDASLIRSGLLANLAAELEAGSVHPKIAYLCGPKASADAWAASFRIQESMPLSWKALERALLDTDWSELEYLSRGVPFSQDEVMRRTLSVRKRMKGRPGGRGAVILYREDRGYRAVLASRVAHRE